MSDTPSLTHSDFAVHGIPVFPPFEGAPPSLELTTPDAQDTDDAPILIVDWIIVGGRFSASSRGVSSGREGVSLLCSAAVVSPVAKRFTAPTLMAMSLGAVFSYTSLQSFQKGRGFLQCRRFAKPSIGNGFGLLSVSFKEVALP